MTKLRSANVTEKLEEYREGAERLAQREDYYVKIGDCQRVSPLTKDDIVYLTDCWDGLVESLICRLDLSMDERLMIAKIDKILEPCANEVIRKGENNA